MSTFKVLVKSIAAVFLLLFSVSRVWAVEMEISCDTGGCTLSTADPLFSESNIYPTWNVSRSIKVKNNYAEQRNFAVEIANASFSDSVPPLSQFLEVIVRETGSSTPLYGPKTFAEWVTDGFIVLSSIPTGGTRSYDFDVSLADVGNSWQGKQLSFNLNLGFSTVPEVLGIETAREERRGTVLPATGAYLGGIALAVLAVQTGLILRRKSNRWAKEST
ncbi:MAG: hypothetical protein GTN80_04520 [Nitrososphaeria archaeon]|nr:hypothetical protein [Nitrososphaeria archaeon]NIT03958.1 hypothetical protein [Candidatus Saccharibacteria bacterium]